MRIEIDVPDGKSGAWAVETFSVTEDDLWLHNLKAVLHPGARTILPGSFKRLTRNGQIVMTNTDAEIRDHLRFIHRGRNGGHILINGLGLGIALKAILESQKVLSVTVIEISEDVIALVAKHYETDTRVKVVHADAFTFIPSKSQRYSAVWHDIWDNICGDNLPAMTKLHRKYGRRADWQGSWAKELCKRDKANDACIIER